MMILTGFAVDYVVHLAHAYMQSFAISRLERTHDALKELGISVFWGMLTSSISAAVLASLQLQFFDADPPKCLLIADFSFKLDTVNQRHHAPPTKPAPPPLPVAPSCARSQVWHLFLADHRLRVLVDGALPDAAPRDCRAPASTAPDTAGRRACRRACCRARQADSGRAPKGKDTAKAVRLA
eukprot:6148962-Pleurochrysis_carterae.AAC.1